MADLIDEIQKIVQDNIEAGKPTDVAFGTVTSIDPFRVSLIGTMQPIPTGALYRTVGVVPRTVSVTGGEGTVIINGGLAVGDKVLMLRVSRGQAYIVLSKVY